MFGKEKNKITEIRKGSMPVIDFHSHILPGADHGSCSLEMSLKQLRIIAAAGTDTVVATPHFYPMKHSVLGFNIARSHALKKLTDRAVQTETDGREINVAIGAEVYVYPGIEQMSTADLDSLCIQGTKTILLEMPTDSFTEEIINTVLEISRSYNVVIAHLDRYSSHEAAKLLALDMKIQLNADNLISKSGRKKFVSFAQNGTVVALGSDLHGCDVKSYEPFKEISVLWEEYYDSIMERTGKYLEGAVFYKM